MKNFFESPPIAEGIAVLIGLLGFSIPLAVFIFGLWFGTPEATYERCLYNMGSAEQCAALEPHAELKSTPN